MSLGLSTVSAATPSSERIASGERARNVRPPGTWWKQKLAPIGEWMNASVGLAFTRHVLHIGVGEDIAAKMCTTKTEMFMHHVRVVLRYCGCPVRTCSLKVAGPAFGQVASASLCSPDGHMIGGAIGGSLIAANPVQKDVVSTSPLTCSSLVARCCRPPPQQQIS
ncbi:PREDICTED: AT-hook motif nuclear-localized protein 9-like [Erythranthe guttata]|uniref:AT-hook motif nuclear-localized protein 9-like n=1 Tax=Erythranthe guttata TaxID=4155 RepID=UPI00064D919E|nr:PREDICTED: AT-hook motif nuclear-localized protein 9-like [Erythranthe guttata]|eukprot:XP_012845301.1 PREDICTED: AT-hook motif nuclear-localized protein 9-like [Erythranthe guttata]